jgi:hypothetical protein
LITGFNTDVEYDGVVYHVQTEDKGLRTPFILSLVYSGGAILASKRSPYDDLVARGFDEAILAQRLSRQHKLICAAVHAGRIEDLKRMSEREPAGKPQAEAIAADEPIEEQPIQEPPPPRAEESHVIATAGEVESVPADAQPPSASLEPADDEEPLKVVLLDDDELRSGESVTFRVRVSRASANGHQPASKVRVVVKTLGTSIRPASKVSATNKEGIALVPVLLPTFVTGRAAVLIQVNADGRRAELRRIILPAKSN